MPNTDSKKSLFEYVTQVVVPASATIAAIFQQQRVIALALIALAFASLVLSATPTLIRRFHERQIATQVNLIVAAAKEETDRHIRKFAQLVNSRTNDTLYQILFGTLCGNNQGSYDSLQLAPNIFGDLSEQLMRRTAQRECRAELLRETIGELNYLIGIFCRYYVCPAYEQIPQRISAEVLGRYNANVECELIQYRERFISFLDGYSDFLRDLEQKLPAVAVGHYFERPKPLKTATAAKGVH